MNSLSLELLPNRNSVEGHIEGCQEANHVQQVAYSTYHKCLTQICFNCKKIRTNMEKGDIEKGGLE